MLCILLTGPPCAGKTTCGEILKEEFNVPVINIGNILKKKLQSEKIDFKSREEIGPTFLNHFSTAAVYQSVMEYTPNNQVVVFDGIRLPFTCKQFKKNYKTSIWYIISDQATLKKRFQKRINTNSKKDIEQIRHSYNKYNHKLDQIRLLADYTITNNKSISNLSTISQNLFQLIVN